MAFRATAVGGNGATMAPPAPGRPTTDFVMPWGKHKGAPLHLVPADYLKWLLANASNLSDELRAEIESQLGLAPGSTRASPEEEQRKLRAEIEQLKRQVEMEQTATKKAREMADQAQRELVSARRGTYHGKPTATKANPKVEEVRVIVKQWYRGLAIRFHPDRGGTTEQQVVVNEAYRSLITEVEKWERS